MISFVNAQIVREYEQSGMSQRQYARYIEVNENTFRRELSEFKKLHPQKNNLETIDDVLALIDKSQELYEEIDPVITHHRHIVKTDKPFVLATAGCLQMGGRWTAHHRIRKILDRRKQYDWLHWGFFGDELEGFFSWTFAGARSQMEQAIQPDLQIALWDRFLDEFAAKTEFGVSSQHGGQWMERHGFNPIKKSYVNRNIPFFDGQGYFQLTLTDGNKENDQVYHLAIAHEFPGRSMLNPTHAQRRALWQRYPMADVIAQADIHQFAITQLDVYGNEVVFGNRASAEVWLVQIGTAKTGADPYTIRGWERGQFGWPYLVFFPDRHQVKATRDFSDVLLWMGENPNEEIDNSD